MIEKVYIYKCPGYAELHSAEINQVLAENFNALKTGQTVLVKPNLVRESALDSDEWESVITNGEVIKLVCLKVAEQLQNRGKIIIADSPETDADFSKICQRLRLNELQQHFRQHTQIELLILDLRREIWRKVDGVIVDKRPHPGDPAGNVAINLGKQSCFYGKTNEDYYGATFDKAETQRHHHGEVHEYLLARTPLSADVFISVPKLKTHKKAGITCCLKNLVGINADKNWLPHHTEGFPDQGGDQFPRKTVKTLGEFVLQEKIKALLKNSLFLSRLSAPFKRFFRPIFGDTRQVIRSGNWYGNDTVWRMVLDLNKILFYFDASGRVRPHPREFIGVVDGIIAGEGNGPLSPEPRSAGLLVIGRDPMAIDITCARLMGFDWRKIPTLSHALTLADFPITSVRNPDTDILLISNLPQLNQKLLGELEHTASLNFKPAPGWRGQIEL